jgi:PucR C-terminal helix-turn-helix domain/GGDEF-like domain
MNGGELAELATWAEARLPRLADDGYARILERVELYRTDHPVPRDDLRRSVEHNLRFVVATIADPSAPRDLTAPEETGYRRAQQGVPLPEVLRAYRILFATLWDTLVDHARRGRSTATADALLAATSMIWQLTDEHALALTEGYRAATAELLTAQQRRRSALVEALLTGHPGPEGGPWEAATLLGLPPDGQLVVVAAETRKLAEEGLPGIERQLAACGIISAWRLTPALQLGVVSLPADHHDTLLKVTREAANTRTGVSPPYQSLADTPRALHLARTALATVPPGQADVRVFSPSPLAALVACDPDEGRRLADGVLGAVFDLQADDRAILLDTLYAYLEHAGSADQAAEVLHCHPNTVRYRLRRLQELTGRSLSDPRTLAELAAAVYAVRPEDRTSGPSRTQPARNGRAEAHDRRPPRRLR